MDQEERVQMRKVAEEFGPFGLQIWMTLRIGAIVKKAIKDGTYKPPPDLRR